MRNSLLILALLFGCTPIKLRPIPQCTLLGDTALCSYPAPYTAPSLCLKDGDFYECPIGAVIGYQMTSPQGKSAIEGEINEKLLELREFRDKCGSPANCKPKSK